MPSKWGIEIKKIANFFPLDLKSTINIQNKKLDSKTELYKVEKDKSLLIPNNKQTGEIYIIDTQWGRCVACHPHIIGSKLEELTIRMAKEFVTSILITKSVELSETAILNILRGASGYKIDYILKDLPMLYTRTEYLIHGYRSHIDAERDIKVTFRKYNGLKSDFSTLIIPDTFATGISALTALKDLLKFGFKPETIILYGFIAIPSILRLANFTSKMGIKLISFAVCNVSQLAYNNYDMPIYGVDESLYQLTHKIEYLGSIINEETLRRVISHYIPGLDQPGDWSERQLVLFNGHKNEHGDTKHHLVKSREIIQKLRVINSQQSWYTKNFDEITKYELQKIDELL